MSIYNVNLTADSIQDVIDKLDKLDIMAKIDEFLERLAQKGMEQAQSDFGSDVTVTSEKVGDGSYTITANGEQVCFLEFGAGVYADSSHRFAKNVSFEVYPGSWSDSPLGKGKWKEWLEKGNDPGEFPYNVLPVRGMLNAYNAMVNNAEEIAREVFG